MQSAEVTATKLYCGLRERQRRSPYHLVQQHVKYYNEHKSALGDHVEMMKLKGLDLGAIPVDPYVSLAERAKHAHLLHQADLKFITSGVTPDNAHELHAQFHAVIYTDGSCDNRIRSDGRDPTFKTGYG